MLYQNQNSKDLIQNVPQCYEHPTLNGKREVRSFMITKGSFVVQETATFLPYKDYLCTVTSKDIITLRPSKYVEVTEFDIDYNEIPNYDQNVFIIFHSINKCPNLAFIILRNFPKLPEIEKSYFNNIKKIMFEGCKFSADSLLEFLNNFPSIEVVTNYFMGKENSFNESELNNSKGEFISKFPALYSLMDIDLPKDNTSDPINTIQDLSLEGGLISNSIL